jgi:hypothetical protein
MSTLLQWIHRARVVVANNPALPVSTTVWDDSHPVTTAAPNGSVVIVDAAQTDGIGAGPVLMIPQDLGGSVQVGIRSAAWITIAERKHPVIASGGVVTATARVERRTAAIATSVQVRVIDVDNAGAVVGTGAIYTADTNWNEETFAITLNAAAHHYELQVQGGNAAADVFALGRIECYAA